MNETDRDDYIQRVRTTSHGVKFYHRCSRQEEMERFMIMSLEEFQLDRSRFAAIFHDNMDEAFAPQLRSFFRRGLIEATETGYRLTPLGRAWATTMAIEFFSPPALEEMLRARLKNAFIGGMTCEDELALPVFAVFHPELLFKDWQDFTLIAEYVRFLRRANPRWVQEFLSLCRRFMHLSRLRALKWYLATALRRLSGKGRRARLGSDSIRSQLVGDKQQTTPIQN